MLFVVCKLNTIKGYNYTMLSTPPASPSSSKVGCCALRRTPPRPPQEIYFESRGKCCKKLLRYNGYPNKVPNYYKTCLIIV